MSNLHQNFWRRLLQKGTPSAATNDLFMPNTAVAGMTKNFSSSALRPLALEQRFMFDAAGAVDAAHAAGDVAADPAVVDHAAQAVSALRQALTAETAQLAERGDAAAPRQEVFFIDGQVPELSQLLQSLPANAEVVVLNPQQDGLQQMADYLQGRSQLDAIHLLSHGADGTVQVGNLWLNSSNLSAHQQALQSIGAALTAEGDLMLYGCSVGESGAGQSFLDAVAQATGADVAASSDATGATALGGNWALERSTGALETQSLYAQGALPHWNYLLATYSAFNGTNTYTEGTDVDAYTTNADLINRNPFFLNETGTYTFIGAVDSGGPSDGTDVVPVLLGKKSVITGYTLNVSGTLVGGMFYIESANNSTFDPRNVTLNNKTTQITSAGLANLPSAQYSIYVGNSVNVFNYTLTLNVEKTNLQPAIAQLDGNSVSYTEDANPVLLDLGSDATVTDADDASFAGGNVTVNISNNGVPTEDVLSVRNEGSGSGQIKVSGSNIYYSNILIGTATGGTGGSALVVSLNADATLDAVTALVRNLTYKNSNNGDINTATRTVQVTVNDGTDNSTVSSVDVAVIAVNDAPTLAKPIAAQNATAGVAFGLVVPADTFSDSDKETLTYSAELANGGALPAWLSFDAATRTFSGKPNNADAGAVSVRVTATDASGASATAEFNLTVAADNTPPTLSITSSHSHLKAGESATITFTFSELPHGFTDADVQVTNGTLSAIAATADPLVFTATLTPASGESGVSVGLSVQAGAYTDDQGNLGAKADLAGIAVDTVAPTLSIISNASVLKAGESTTITFTFSEELGSTFDSSHVTVTGGSLSNWDGTGLVRTATFTPTQGVNNGTAEFTVANGAYKDKAGNPGQSVEKTLVTFDTLAPTTTVSDVAFSTDTGVAGDFVTSAASQTITAALSSPLQVGEKLEASMDGGATWVDISSNVADKTLTWSGASLKAGSHTLQLRVSDAAGNAGVQTNRAYILDTVAPGIPSAPQLASASDSGQSNSDRITKNTNPTLTGTAEAGSNVSIYKDDTLLETVRAVGGEWSFTFGGSGLSEGSYNFKVIAEDLAGNKSPASSVTEVVVDTTAPQVNSVDVPTDKVYYIGSNLDFTVNYSEAVYVDTSHGKPRLALTVGNAARYAEYVSGSGTAALLFRYVVDFGDSDTDGISVGTLVNNGGSLQDIAANDAVLTLNSVADTSGVLVDGLLPSVKAISSNTQNGSYGAGSPVAITVQFSTAVTVTGTPTLALNSGGTASYASGSGSDTLTFHYTVAAGENATDLDVASINALQLQGGSIIEFGGPGRAAWLTLGTPGGEGSLGSNKNIVIDTLAPLAPPAPVLSTGSDSGSDSSDRLTNVQTPVIAGTAEVGSTVTLYDTDGATVLGTAQAGIDGAWSITSTTLSKGSHTISAIAQDAVGNRSPASAGLVIVIDHDKPTDLSMSLGAIASVSAVPGATVGLISSQDSHSVTYRLVAGNGVDDADNGKFLIVGNTLQVANTLGVGTYSVYVAATDAAGNEAKQQFTVNVVDAPVVTSIVRAGGASHTVQAAASEVVYTVKFSQAVTGVDTTDFILTKTQTASGDITGVSGSGDTYTVTVSGLKGDGTLRLDLKDSGTGIQSTTQAIVGGYTAGALFTLDHTAPSQVVSGIRFSADTGYSNADLITNTAAQTLTATLSSALGAGEMVWGSLDGGSNWTDITTKVSGTALLWDGVTLNSSNAVQFKVVDIAGNQGGVVSSAYVLDQLAPTVGITSNVTVANGVEPAVITFTFSEAPQGFDRSDISVLGGDLDGLTATSDPKVYTALFRPTTGIASGTASIAVSNGYTDAAGNTGGVGTLSTLQIDTVAPEASTTFVQFSADTGVSNSDLITNVAAQTISGTLSHPLKAGEVVHVSLNNGAAWIPVSTAVGDSSWTLSAMTLAAGSNILLVKVSDAVGNHSTIYSKAYNFDSTPPSAATVDSLQSNSLTPTLSGTATLAHGEVLTVSVAGATYNVVPTGGVWSLDLANATPVSGVLALTMNRQYDVVAIITDEAGNSTQDARINELTLGVVVIPTPPAPPVVEPPVVEPPVVEPPVVEPPVVEPPVVEPPVVEPPVVEPPVVEPPVVEPPVVEPPVVEPPVVEPPVVQPPVVVPPTPPFLQAPLAPLPVDQGNWSGEGAVAPVYSGDSSTSESVDTNSAPNALVGGAAAPLSVMGGSHQLASGFLSGVVGGDGSSLGSFTAGSLLASPVWGLGFGTTQSTFDTAEGSRNPTEIVDLNGAGRSAIQGYQPTPLKSSGSSSLQLVVPQSDVVPANEMRQLQWRVPSSMFGHTDSSAVISFSMEQVDGQPLPAWIKIDAKTGQVSGQVPADFTGEIVLNLIARDDKGNEVTTTVKFKAGGVEAPRAGLAEQLQRVSQQRSGHMAAQRLSI